MEDVVEESGTWDIESHGANDGVADAFRCRADAGGLLIYQNKLLKTWWYTLTWH